MSIRLPRHHGRYKTARLRLRASFTLAIITATFADGASMPMTLIAKDCGFRHAQRLSNLLHAHDGVPITTRPLFERVARILRYPAEQIFVEPPDPTPRLVKRAMADEARP